MSTGFNPVFCSNCASISGLSDWTEAVAGASAMHRRVQGITICRILTVSPLTDAILTCVIGSDGTRLQPASRNEQVRRGGRLTHRIVPILTCVLLEYRDIFVETDPTEDRLHTVRQP